MSHGALRKICLFQYKNEVYFDVGIYKYLVNTYTEVYFNQSSVYPLIHLSTYPLIHLSIYLVVKHTF